MSDTGEDKPGVPAPTSNPYAEKLARGLYEDRENARSVQRLLRTNSKEWRQQQDKIDAVDLKLTRLSKLHSSDEGSSNRQLKRARRPKRRVLRKDGRKVSLRSSSKATQAKDVEPSNRRDAINSFINRMKMATGLSIKRKNIWKVAGYTDPTQFQRFQRNDPRTTQSAIAQFNQVLKMMPEDFRKKVAEQR